MVLQTQVATFEYAYMKIPYQLVNRSLKLTWAEPYIAEPYAEQSVFCTLYIVRYWHEETIEPTSTIIFFIQIIGSPSIISFPFSVKNFLWFSMSQVKMKVCRDADLSESSEKASLKTIPHICLCQLVYDPPANFGVIICTPQSMTAIAIC